MVPANSARNQLHSFDFNGGIFGRKKQPVCNFKTQPSDCNLKGISYSQPYTFRETMSLEFEKRMLLSIVCKSASRHFLKIVAGKGLA